MRILLNSLFIPIFIICLISSCEYEPSEKYFRDISKNVPFPNLQTVQLNLEDDTICLFSDSLVHFLFSCDNKKIQGVVFYIDDEQKFIEYLSFGNFTIQIEPLEEGFHTLTMELYTSTNTGSIADKIGAESFMVKQVWILNVIKNLNKNIYATNENGYLKIHWDQNKTNYIKNFIVYRNNVEIGSTELSEYIDSSYVGQTANYIVKFKTINNSIRTLNNISLSENFPKLRLLISDKTNYFVYWDKLKYFNAVDSIVLSGKNTAKISTGTDDTICKLNTVIFGDLQKFTLSIYPKNSVLKYKISNEFLMGIPTPFHKDYPIFPLNSDTCIFSSSDTIYKYSVSRNKIVEKFYRPYIAYIDVSPSGKYMTGKYYNNRNVFFSPTDKLNQWANVDLYALVFDFKSTYMPVSDVGTGIITDFNNVYVIDYAKFQILGSYYCIYSTSDKRKISSEGNYLFNPSYYLQLLQYNNNEINLIWQEDRTFTKYFFEFSGTDPDQLVFWDGVTFSIRNCEDFSVIKQFNFNREKVLHVDFHKRKILSFSEGHFYINNLNDGNQLNDILTIFNDGFLINDLLISNNLMYYLE